MPTISLPVIFQPVTPQAPTVAGTSATIAPLPILRRTTVRRGPRVR
jgi:hypothetical protein